PPMRRVRSAPRRREMNEPPADGDVGSGNIIPLSLGTRPRCNGYNPIHVQFLGAMQPPVMRLLVTRHMAGVNEISDRWMWRQASSPAACFALDAFALFARMPARRQTGSRRKKRRTTTTQGTMRLFVIVALCLFWIVM